MIYLTMLQSSLSVLIKEPCQKWRELSPHRPIKVWPVMPAVERLFEEVGPDTKCPMDIQIMQEAVHNGGKFPFAKQ